MTATFKPVQDPEDEDVFAGMAAPVVNPNPMNVQTQFERIEIARKVQIEAQEAVQTPGYIVGEPGRVLLRADGDINVESWTHPDEFYRVAGDLSGCDCPDWQYRGRHEEPQRPCKHLALAHAVISNPTPRTTAGHAPSLAEIHAFWHDTGIAA